MKMRLDNEEHKLIIQLNKEFNVLQKKIHLHEHEIKRIQGLATKYALKKGKYEGDLKRTKNRAKLQNDIIKQSKAIESYLGRQDSVSNSETAAGGTQGDFWSTQVPGYASPMSGGKRTTRAASSFARTTQHGLDPPKKPTVQSLKLLINSGNISKFYIRQKYGADLPVNLQYDPFRKETPDDHFKIEKFLIAKKKNKFDILPSLTDLYDENLEIKKVMISNNYLKYIN